MRYRIRYETRGFDEYLNIYDEKNKLEFYSVEVDYARPKRLLYTRDQQRIAVVDFGTEDIDDLVNGYPIYINGKKIGFYDDSLDMENTSNVEFAHIMGPDWRFIENSERLNFKEYTVEDADGNEIMKIKRPGRDFICDISERKHVALALLLASIEFWRYITTTREF